MIEINNLLTISVDDVFLKKIVKIVLRGEKINEESGLSVVFVGFKRMLEINKKYRGKNRATDVLSFSDAEVLEEFKFISQKKIRELGEIIICPNEVKKNVKQSGLSFEEELSKVLIHGVLHLLGYNHEQNEKEAKTMKAKEEYYSRKIYYKH